MVGLKHLMLLDLVDRMCRVHPKGLTMTLVMMIVFKESLNALVIDLRVLE
jgi:hypothetical protein